MLSLILKHGPEQEKGYTVYLETSKWKAIVYKYFQIITMIMKIFLDYA